MPCSRHSSGWVAAGELAAQFPHWEQLHSIGVAISYRIENMKSHPEHHYFICSKRWSGDEFSRRCVGTGPSKIACIGYLVLDVTMARMIAQSIGGDAAEILVHPAHGAEHAQGRDFTVRRA